MKQSNPLQRTWLSAVGVATAATTVVAGWAPVAHGTTATPQRDNALRQSTAGAADGTYESCGAYFGFGKADFGVLDIVAFDVTDQNGSDSVPHSVPSDTQVVLSLTNETGDVLECTPVEVTEAMWDAELASDPISYLNISADHPLPTWPGPGHFIYPTVNYEPTIDGFGEVRSVGFRVTGVPTGHTLVSPTGVQPLATHYPAGPTGWSNVVDPLTQDYLSTTAGPAAAAAFETALESCGPDADGSADFDTDLNDALDALRTYQDFYLDPGEYDCSDVVVSNGEVSFLLGLGDTVNYREPIVLSVPESPEAPATTAPAAIDPATAAPAAPVAMQPTYTG